MKQVFSKPSSLSEWRHPYCPGCSHGITQRLAAEALDELGLANRPIGVIGNGCYAAARYALNIDTIRSLHGRAPAMATGIKRARPDNLVFTMQGDGDLAAIGLSEVIHACQRAEPITVLFLNNAGFGMTGGQMAPTTLIGQKTATTPKGRDAAIHGHTLQLLPLLQALPGCAYAARVSTHDYVSVGKAKQAVKRAFKTQLNRLGFSIVEILSACPTDWHMTPVEALDWIANEMIAENPLGELKVPEFR